MVVIKFKKLKIFLQIIIIYNLHNKVNFLLLKLQVNNNNSFNNHNNHKLLNYNNNKLGIYNKIKFKDFNNPNNKQINQLI